MYGAASRASHPSRYPTSRDDRHHKFSNARSSELGSSSSSLTHGSGTYSHPSPSSSTTSTSSSLRTPPDLLLNGSSLASSVTVSHSGKVAAGSNPRASPLQARHLSIAQLEDRLKLLGKLSKVPISSDLPSPPSSPRFSPSSSIDNRKRKAEDYSKTDKVQKPRRLSGPKPTISDSVPEARAWTKELYFETAAAYRTQGRDLKHRGDRRMRDASSQDLASPRGANIHAALEQTDALLLYTYGFWCEDQGGGICVPANWTSLYGLLKYVYLCHERNQMPILSGLCRLIEALVLRHVAMHDTRMLHHRIKKQTGKGVNESPPELALTLGKIVGDQDRSSRLYGQARQSILNYSLIHSTYPHLAELCRDYQQNAFWNMMDPGVLSSRLDPSSIEMDHQSWTWPIDLSSSFPMLVCFGRAVLREAAKKHSIPFETLPVKVI